MEQYLIDPALEVKRLQHCVNDLVSLLALPAVWNGSEPVRILETVLDALLGMLNLDFLYARVSIGSRESPIEVFKPAQSNAVSHRRDEILQALSRRLAETMQLWSTATPIDLGDQEISLFPMLMGVNGDLGIIIAGSGRPGFPEQIERLVLGVAANQTAIGLQQALILNEQRRVASELDHRVSQRTAELAAANQILKKEIAERREVEKRLLESEGLLRKSEANLWQVIDTIPTFASCSSPEGANEFLSRGWHEYTGISHQESHGWGWQTAFHPEDLSAFLKRWHELLAAGQPGEMEARLRRHDGVYRWFLMRNSPFRDETGNIVRWYGTSTDIHDWKQAQEELRSTQAELTRMMRVLTMGQLTASIAHEVSQPLSGILTNASTCLRMLNNDPPNIDGARETAQRTIRDGNRATDVITRLRTLFSKKQINIESVDLNEAAREVIALLLSELQKDRVLLRHQFSENLPRVMGDRVQLQQVILNLLRNASDAMTIVDDRPRRLLIRTDTNGELVRVSVKDSGVGFDPEITHRLFQPFFTTKQEGMGIGLSVSRSIVEAHHGQLWAARNDGPGATFAFSIPYRHEPQPHSEP